MKIEMTSTREEWKMVRFFFNLKLDRTTYSALEIYYFLGFVSMKMKLVLAKTKKKKTLYGILYKIN